MYNPSKMMLSIARNRLLATVSTLTLITSACGCEVALAAGSDRDQTLWMELGWQADSVGFSKRDLDLPLGPLVPPSGLTATLLQHLKTDRSNDVDSKITYKPEDSNWNFSASVRYGRSAQGKSKIDQALAPIPTTSFVSFEKSFINSGYVPRRVVKHVVASRDQLSADASNAEAHLVVDFDAGKDVGLGMFGNGSTSTLGAGIRFAHFEIGRQVSNFQETQGIRFQTSRHTYYSSFVRIHGRELWNGISANGSISQNFNGIGPSIRWDASAQLWSDPRGGGVSLDWGANAAFLFGKQTKTTHHQTTNTEDCIGWSCPNYHAAVVNDRVKSSRTITVPNVGGFIGLSLSSSDAKIALGYRADFFFNAMDGGGVDTRENENRSFYGPFASISLSLGD